MSADVGEVKDGKGEAGEAAHVHFVGGNSGGCTDGVVVRALDMWELDIAVSLMFVVRHGEHEGHGVVDMLATAVGAQVAGARGNLIDAEAVQEGEGNVWRKTGVRCRKEE